MIKNKLECPEAQGMKDKIKVRNSIKEKNDMKQAKFQLALNMKKQFKKMQSERISLARLKNDNVETHIKTQKHIKAGMRIPSRQSKSSSKQSPSKSVIVDDNSK